MLLIKLLTKILNIKKLLQITKKSLKTIKKQP